MQVSQHSRTALVIGGGFGGVTAARALEKQLPDDWRILILSNENYITYNPLLAEVVGASILPGHVVAPIRQMLRRTEFRMLEVHDIDLQNKQVLADARDGAPIRWDQLVLACGKTANLAPIPGMAEHGVPFKMLGDALELRNRVLMQLEQAEMEDDPDKRRCLTSFVIVGGGFSGVEVAGEIHDFLRSACRYYPRVNVDDCTVNIAHSRDRLLNEISSTLGLYAARKMEAGGIRIHLNARVAQADATGITLESGERLEGATIVCTVGNTPNPLVRKLDLEMHAGSIVTRSDMSVPGHPDVWAIGDCALVTNEATGLPAPPTAQFAIPEARQMAANMKRHITNAPTRPFYFRSRGQLASIGRNKAVAEIFGLRVSGFVAWLLWRGFYLLKIPTLLRKIRIFFEWNWEMLFPPDIAHLRFTRSPGADTVVPKTQTPSGTTKKQDPQ